MCVSLYVRVCLCVCVLCACFITSSVMWHDRYEAHMFGFHKCFNYYLAAVVGIIRLHGLRIEVQHRNLPNKTKPVLYKPLLYFKGCLKQLCISNKMKCFSYKGGCGVLVIKCLKELGLYVASKQHIRIQLTYNFCKTNR